MPHSHDPDDLPLGAVEGSVGSRPYYQALRPVHSPGRGKLGPLDEGYRLHLVFLWLDSPDLAVARVEGPPPNAPHAFVRPPPPKKHPDPVVTGRNPGRI